MPVAAELARKIPSKETKKGGDGASMPPLKDVLGSRGGQPQEVRLSSLTTTDRLRTPRTNDDDKKEKGTAVFDSSLNMSSVKTSNEVTMDGGSKAICDYTDGGAAPAVELFALDQSSLITRDGEPSLSSNLEGMCTTLQGGPECPLQAQEGKGGKALESDGPLFSVIAVDSLVFPKNMELDTNTDSMAQSCPYSYCPAQN